MDPTEIQALIEDGLAKQGSDDAVVRIMSDDNTHYAALVISDLFDGKRAIARHQMIYQCLGERMGNEIHAMSIRAHTSDEWAELQDAPAG